MRSGRRFGPALRRSRAGRRVGEARWARAEAYLARHGGRAVFFGRWAGLLRALVPALAGMARLPYKTFLPYNIAGGLTWAPVVVLAGYLAGDSYQQVHRLTGQAGLAIGGVLAVLIAVAWAMRRLRRRRSAAAARWVSAGSAGGTATRTAAEDRGDGDGDGGDPGRALAGLRREPAGAGQGG
jgi:membrane-associated protein